MKLKNLVGQKFNRLLVIERAPNKTTQRERTSWKCLCDCGQVVDIEGQNLKSKNSKSCGCYSDEIKRSRATLLNIEACVKDRLKDYQVGAQERNLSFTLTLEQFTKLISQDCHYCGHPPSQVIPQGRAKIPYVYTGIDRKDNAIGYEVDNCLPCCKECNFAKSSRTYQDFNSWLDRITKFRYSSTGRAFGC